MSAASINDTRQYLSFKLGDEVFGLEVSNVREILELTNVTKVPKTPDFMIGVINLRGSVVPVLDMRIKFGLACMNTTINTCIIVVEVDFEGESTIIGALVDSVQEVFELEPDQIEPPLKIGTHLNTEFMKGMGKRNDHFFMILDINKVFSFEEKAMISASEEKAEMKLAGNA